MAVDIAGTIRVLAKWALKEALLLLGVIVFGLSVPLLFTAGMLAFVWQSTNPDDIASLGTVYLFLGPFGCAIWMVFICYLADPKYWRAFRREKSGEIHSWREDYGGDIYSTVGRSMGFMAGGFFGSIVAEGILLVAMHTMFPDGLPGRADTMIFFAIAPFAVFAPCWIVMLNRWIRRDEYATD